MILLEYLRTSVLGLLRTPSYSVVTITLPGMLFLFLGSSLTETRMEANLVLASFCVFATLGVAFFQFGVGIANERESPWEMYARVLPVHPWVRLASTVLSSLIFVALAVGVLIVVALLSTEAGMGAGAWLRMLFAVLVGSIPMAALGVAIGYWSNPKAALPIANLLYILLAFLGGIFLRPELMPEFLDRISLMTPVRHICELTWAAVLGSPWSLASFLWLLAFTVAFGALAIAGQRRDEGIRYG